ncbi:MAG: class I SAM-dependent methyltransferase [Desulfocapsa sp.]|nr:class I SAM-dependent methyltransferase [Desulfocapsa sp.]
MNQCIREIAKKVIPRPILISVWAFFCHLRSRKTKRLFERAATPAAWLPRETLEELQDSYPLEKTTYLYDEQSMERRGRDRAQALLNMVPKHEQMNRFLDLGCWDGMTCYELQRMKKTAIGIDVQSEGLTEKARHAKTPFAQMDIEALGFADNSFDFVFSYYSFEHFPDPELALQEALRVVRVGGYISLHFGPLYMAPKGAHQSHVITVPYCQCLFRKEVLLKFAQDRGLELNPFHWMNEWRLEQYRQLWSKYAHRMKTVTYYEIDNVDHLDLIASYPSCFRSKTHSFDDLIVSSIEVLFKKLI